MLHLILLGKFILRCSRHGQGLVLQAAYSKTDTTFTPLKATLPRGEKRAEKLSIDQYRVASAQIGGRRILFLGVDFAHVNGQSHGKGLGHPVGVAGFDSISRLDWSTESFEENAWLRRRSF